VVVINSCRQPSDVYDTHRQTKLTAPETIRHCRDMVSAHQSLNGSRDLTTPLSGTFAIRGLSGIALSTVNLPTSFEVPNSILYKDIKGDTKCRKWGGLGVDMVTQGHWK